MNVLIIPDSFKGSLTAIQVANIMKKVTKRVFPKSKCILMPFSDAGEGALSLLEENGNGKLVNCYTSDALERKLKAPYFLFDKGKSAWIELSQSAGITRLKKHELNPLITSTLGTGQMINHALNLGCENIYLGIGGSATHDLGSGIITALGGRLLDKNGKQLSPGGGALSELNQIDISNLDPRINQTDLTVACDVQNPLTGANGAAYTYAKQKGASKKVIEKLENSSKVFSKVVYNQFNIEIENLKGGGAAGGVGSGLFGVFNAKIENGFQLLAKKTDLSRQINTIDLVLTGEGHFDKQSSFGKLPFQVAKLAVKKNIPTLIIAGKASIKKIPRMPNVKIFETKPKEMSLESAMKFASINLDKKLNDILIQLKNHDSITF